MESERDNEGGKVHGVDPEEWQVKRRKKSRDNVGSGDSVGTCTENEVAQKQSDEVTNIVVRFEGQGGVKKMDLLKFDKNPWGHQVGQMKYARVLRDGNLLERCVCEKQVRKAKGLRNVREVNVVNVVKVGNKNNASRGVTYGIPLNADVKKLAQGLKMKNSQKSKVW